MKRFFSILLLLAVLTGVGSVPLSVSAEITPTHKLIALTFDDGPGFHTDRLLDGLAEYDVKATFFVSGENGSALGAAFHQNRLIRIVDEGHQLANHTYHHRVPFSDLSPEEMVSQTDRVNALLYDAMGGEYQTLVRTPGGADSETIRENIHAPIIMWGLDTLDWKYRNSETVCNTILEKAYDGAVVLLHDIHSTSVDGVLAAIPELQKEGYEFVTVSELFRRRGISLQNGTVYADARNKGTTLPAYTAPVITASPEYLNEQTAVSLSSPYEDMTLYYTTDGSSPTQSSTRYDQPFTLPYGTLIRVVGYDRFGTRTPVASQKLRQNYEGVFDAIYYARRYPELKQKYGIDEHRLLEHFLTRGIYEGRQAAVTFDITYYMNRHTELQATLGKDPTAYMHHFLTKGMAAGHRASSQFDPMSYRLSYPDLRRQYGNDWAAYYTHYLRKGQKEGLLPCGRTTLRGAVTEYNGVNYAAVYDYDYYSSRYTDVCAGFAANDTAAIKHFVTKGMQEGRVGSLLFSVQMYKTKYQDLQEQFGDNLKAYYLHYMKHGLKEGRTDS